MARSEYYQLHKEKLKQIARQYSRDNKEKVKITNKKQKLKKYGLTYDSFIHMLTTQDNCCALCGKRFNGERYTCVDHNHTTGQTRELLCLKCNLGIGYFEENISLLHKAEQYINKWNQ